ncbi:hypothetical protein HDG35_005811 [Paraburkholderia sp. JPY681]|nr:hypothetical protein [Paraburkholderia atlantica]
MKRDSFQGYLLRRVTAARQNWLPATVLIRELQEAGYAGGINQIKASLEQYKRPKAEPVVRFEAPSGKQRQANLRVTRCGRVRLLPQFATLAYDGTTFVRLDFALKFRFSRSRV